MAQRNGAPNQPPKKRRPRLSQEDVPGYSLEQALRVPMAIAENYAYNPTRPMHVAGAMGMTPTSGPFRGITGAAVAYGLTTGAANSGEIGITPIGLRIVRPTSEGDDLVARREALLKPKVIGEFLRAYDGAALPPETIAKNVLQEKGVPVERLSRVLELILEGAGAVGFIKEIAGKRYVDLASPSSSPTSEKVESADTSPDVTDFSRRTVARPTEVSIGPGVHVNIEIHIAADASSETIEEIFRNMRRYVLSPEGPSDSDAATGG